MIDPGGLECAHKLITLKPGGPACLDEGPAPWICVECAADIPGSPHLNCRECLAQFVQCAAITLGRLHLTEEEVAAVRDWMGRATFEVLLDVREGLRALFVVNHEAVDVDLGNEEACDRFIEACFRINRLLLEEHGP